MNIRRQVDVGDHDTTGYWANAYPYWNYGFDWQSVRNTSGTGSYVLNRNKYYIDLPGFEEDDVYIDYDPFTALMKIEASCERDGRKRSFSRTIALYHGEEPVSAELKNGVLSVTIKKKKGKNNVRIPINKVEE